MRGVCPSPTEYHCCNVFSSYKVIKNTIIIGDDYEQDEYEHKPPLKRSIIKINLDYYDIKVFPSSVAWCYEPPQFETGSITDNINELIEKFKNNG